MKLRKPASIVSHGPHLQYVSAGSRGQMFSDGTFNLLMLMIANCSCSYDCVWQTSVRMTTENYVLETFFSLWLSNMHFSAERQPF